MRKTIKLTTEFVSKFLPQRKQNSNKGCFGSVLNIAGSLNYSGAAFLSSMAPLRTGAGYVTLAAIHPVIAATAAKTSEIVFCPLVDTNGVISHQNIDFLQTLAQKHTVVSIGCGLGSFTNNDDKISEFLIGFLDKLKYSDIKMVIDADALNVIAKHRYTALPKNSVLTPHPKELARLLNLPLETVLSDKIKYTELAADKYNTTVLTKGFTTVIASCDCIYINETGNSALAKAGTGDVLTGIISGFAAQGATLPQAAALGAYLHGLAGKTASDSLTQYGVLATDVINFIPTAIKNITHRNHASW